MTHGSRALVHVEVTHLGLDGRHDLDGRGAGPDDGHPPAGEVDVVVPLRGVEQVTGERLDALDLGELRRGQATGRVDQRGAREVARGRPHPPQHRLVVPRRLEELDAEVEAVEHAGLGRDLLQVREDLGLRGVGVRPVGVRREREAVEVARDVAGRARVGVGPPRAAERLVLLDDEELLPVLLEADRQGHAGEAGADDEVVDVGGERHAPDATGGRQRPSTSRSPGSRAGSSAGSASKAQSERFHSGTGVRQSSCGTKRDRRTSS